MKRSIFASMLVFLLAAAPASAEPWGTDYQMGTMVAYGGSDEEGRISFECVDPASGAANAGTTFLRIVPMAGISISKKDQIELVALWTDNGGGSLPVAVELDGDELGSSEELSDSLNRSVLRMLEVGNRLRITTADRAGLLLVDMALTGSEAALEGFGTCIGRDP